MIEEIPQETAFETRNDIKRWEDLVRYANEFVSHGRFLFRGQAVASWSLIPSLLRELENCGIGSNTKALEIENQLLEDFKAASHLYVSPGLLASLKSRFVWWALMQHYGAPTRLLDWSNLFFVGLYFAVVDSQHEDGALWCLDKTTSGQLSHDSVLSESPDDEDGPLSQPSEPSSIQDFRFYSFTAPEKSERLLAQSGYFTCSNHIAIDHASLVAFRNYRLTDGRTKMVKLLIPGRIKAECLRHLQSFNISAKTLFPGIDGFSRGLRDRLRAGLFQNE